MKCRNFENCENELNAQYELRMVYDVNYVPNRPKWNKNKPMGTMTNLCADCIQKISENILPAINKILET